VNALDLAIAAIVVLSGLFAFARGFVKEALSIGAWAGAAFAAFYALPYARPMAERFTGKGPAADALAGVAVFVLAIIVLSLVTSAISRRVKASSLSALDRTFGLIFGLARGAFLVCLAYVALAWLLPPGDQRPRWMAEARTLPLLKSGADQLARFVPAGMRERTMSAASGAEDEAKREAAEAMRAYMSPKPRPQPNAAAPAPPAYTPEDKRDLNRLFQQNAR
jgi:membrane protein required for colicin V production